MLESKPISGERPQIFTDLVYDLRREALNGTDVLGLLNYIARRLCDSNIDLDSSVQIGPEVGSALRLALISYLDLAFGVFRFGLGELKDTVWTLQVVDNKFTSKNRDELELINRRIETNRSEWADNLGSR